jgi:dTDP-glucose 4,6-dehydratase
VQVPKLWLSGAGGFIGHHVLEHVVTQTDWDVEATDSFRHKGRCDRITQVLDGRTRFIRSKLHVTTHDLAAPFTAGQAAGFGEIDYMIAMASESHVDRSLADPVPFVTGNVAVILNTLELARQLQPQHVIVISTDEVYGPTARGSAGHPEWAPVIPSNPYSASKAAQEACAAAWWRSYGVPVTIVNCMNLFGERQDPEKYLPMLIGRISAGETVTVHGTPSDIGTRHYLHARNLADALLHILASLPPPAFPAADRPARWNIASPDPVSNLDLALQVAGIIGEPLRYDLADFHSARPGHDPHYGLDPSALAAAGWKPPVPFAESLERTVRWSLSHPEWLR